MVDMEDSSVGGAVVADDDSGVVDEDASVGELELPDERTEEYEGNDPTTTNINSIEKNVKYGK